MTWQYTSLPADSLHLDKFLGHGWKPFAVTHKDQLLVHLRRPAPEPKLRLLPPLPEPAPVTEDGAWLRVKPPPYKSDPEGGPPRWWQQLREACHNLVHAHIPA